MINNINGTRNLPPFPPLPGLRSRLPKRGAGVGEKIPELRSYSKQEGEVGLQTFHRISTRIRENFIPLEDESIDLVVTSPPYPNGQDVG